MELDKGIGLMFNRSQESAADHPKLVKTLKKVYNQCEDPNEFLHHFLECLKLTLIHGERETSVNLSLDFAAKFVTSFENGNEDPDAVCHPFYEGVFDFLLKNHNAKNQAVRFRVCQFINRLLDELSETASINAELFEKIYDTMLERIQDRIASVRVQAVVALQRLQDPTNKECPVIKAMVFHLERDPHPEVRKAVLKSLGCSYFTLTYVLARLRDVKEAVRRQTFVFISERVHVRSLSIANRVEILKLGLNDRSAAVTTVVQDKLIPAWVAAMDGCLFGLLRGLDVEGSADLAVRVLLVWFKTLNYSEVTGYLSFNEDHLVKAEDLKPEVGLLWQTAVAFLRSEGHHASDALESIMPEMTAFGKYLKGYVTEQLKQNDDMEILSMEFIVEQLLKLTPSFDLADEAGRLNLSRDLCDLLQNDKTSPSLTRILVKGFSLIEPRLEVRISKLLEVISELREPLTQAEIPISEDQLRKNKLEIAQCRVQLNELKDELETAIADQEFATAQGVKLKISDLEAKLTTLTTQPTDYNVEEIREERDDPTTLLKCLNVVCELLKNAPMLKMTKELDQLLNTLILPCVERVDPAVRNAAFEALGSLCTCDLELAQQRLLLFVQAVQMDHTVLQVTTAKVLFDLVQLFGLPNFEDKENGMSLGTVLTDLLDSEDADVQTIAVEGFAKLFISSRIESAEILSRLVIYLFHPLSEDNTRLRQVLHVFFPFFASMSMRNQQQLEEAFLPTLQTFLNAPITNPLAEVDIAMVVKMFVDLTQKTLLVKKPEVDHTIHDQLALKLCAKALKNPDSGEGRVYLKALNQLSPSFSNPSHTRDLESFTQKLMQKTTDKKSRPLVERFDILVRCHLQPTADTEEEATIESVDEEAKPPATEPVVKPRVRQLGSKHGATLLMDLTGASDVDVSQNSTVFNSPAGTALVPKRKTSKVTVDDKSNEEVEIEMFSSSASSSVAGSDSERTSKTKRTTRQQSITIIEDSDEDSDVVPPTPPSPPRRTRATRATSKR